MSVILWWKERLEKRQPMGDPALWRLDQTYKASYENKEDTWPRAVSKQPLYQDYIAWFQGTYLPPYLAAGFFADFPDQLPKPATELEFFTAMSPLLHIVGRDQQTRSYNVREQRKHEGSWVTIKVKKNFCRLLEWEAHVAAFELQTGIPILGLWAMNSPGDGERMQTIAKGVTVVLKRMATNKESMDRSMGSPRGD